VLTAVGHVLANYRRFRIIRTPFGCKVCTPEEQRISKARFKENIMTNRLGTSRTALCGNFRLLAFAPALLCALTVIAMPAMQAQTLQILHVISDSPASVQDYGGVTLDSAGNLYGTFALNAGSVWELKREHSSWIFQPLYYFQPHNDGSSPEATVVFGPDGALYGTTYAGGYSCYVGSDQCGTVFSVRPSPNPCVSVICLWNETRVYWFGTLGVSGDGSFPGYGRLIFDSAGNIYGTTQDGGFYGEGTVFELVKTANGWRENVLYSFSADGGPQSPFSGVTFDAAGNLYGTTYYGGTNHAGTVFELIHSEQGWTEKTLYSFGGANDGANPIGGLVFDAAGNVYGSTAGRNGGLQSGTVFQLSPQADGTWTETVLHVFDGLNGPWSSLVIDAAGNLYGSTPGTPGQNDDHNGMVFKLSQVNGSWTFTRLHEFNGFADGSGPYGGVTFDAAGNLYGSCISGGANDEGTIWELTP
jgi:hypothetical protein